MSDIVAFIRARLDETAERAWAIHDVGKCDALLYEEDMEDAAATMPDCDCGYPESVLADIAAKRAILESTDGLVDRHFWLWEEVRKQLALPYAAHPDYDPDWRR